jgi:hypothetical protein
VHLTPEEFIDVAEGTRTEASLPHLATCEACRDQLVALRGAMTVAVETDVPEPSPLFWPNLSARVSEQIDAQSHRPSWLSWMRPRVLVPLSAAALLALVVALMPYPRGGWFTSSNRTVPAPPAAASTAAIDSTNDTADLDADPLLTLVSDLSANMDMDSASAAGFAERDSAEHAVTHMSADELRSLKQLLQAELTRSGA